MASEALDALVEMLRANPPVAGTSIHEMRAGMAAMTDTTPLPEGVAFDPVDAAGVAAEWTQAHGTREDRALLYLHGGGYVMGSVATHRLLCASLSTAADCRVLSVDYRLAPEHPFPAAVEDAVAAYGFLRQSLTAAEIAVAGDSAGGGLTAACLVALRDAGAELPAAGVCISPWLDMKCSGETFDSKADIDPMVQRDTLSQMADAYVGNGDPEHPHASPVYADLKGLPPVLIQVGTAETLLDDSIRFSQRAREDGVDITLEAWDDMIHVWHAFALMLPEGQQAIDRVGEFLQDRWNPGESR